jgi:hypothetical protein
MHHRLLAVHTDVRLGAGVQMRQNQVDFCPRTTRIEENIIS